MEAKKRIGFHVSAGLYKEIRLLAAEKGVSIRALLLNAIEQTYGKKEVVVEK